MPWHWPWRIIFSKRACTTTHSATDWVEGWENWRDYLFDQRIRPGVGGTAYGYRGITRSACLAEEIAAADGCVIFSARGINQHANGTQTNRALLFVAAITGNMGRKGGAYFNFGTTTPVVANAPMERRRLGSRPRAG